MVEPPTPLQLAVAGVLARNTALIDTLDGTPGALRSGARAALTQHAGFRRLRAGAPPSPLELALGKELDTNLRTLLALQSPAALLPATQPPLQTVLTTSRALGLLPLPADSEANETSTAAHGRASGPSPLTGLQRSKLRRLLPGPPNGFTGAAWHKLGSLEGVTFFCEAEVLDLNEETGQLNETPFRFHLAQPGHGVSFGTGVGSGGELLLSYSVCHAFYTLPDGTNWAEHTNLLDQDDLQAAAPLAQPPFALEAAELVARRGRLHTRLSEAEFDFHVFSKAEFDARAEEGTLPDGAFFVRLWVDLTTMQCEQLEAAELLSPAHA